jgi:hypothetical protein
MAQASALPGFTDGHSLAQHIALHLKHGPALILIAGCNIENCQLFLDSLSAALVNPGRIVRLNASDPAASLFDQIASVLGLLQESAASLTKHLNHASTLLLCSMGHSPSSNAFEQLRQLSNLQPKEGYLSIILCGDSALSKQLPNALRQRITASYRLDKDSGILRYATWGILFLALIGSAWLAHKKFPALPSGVLPIKQASPASNQLLGTSLKAQPVLAQSVPAKIEIPLTHVFQTEAEAEAALQAGAPVEKSDQ